jgi:hypothetical protein
MISPLQWDKLRLKAWSWLRGRLLQGCLQYENKVGTTKGIHLLNFQGEKNPKGVQNPS